MISKVTLHNFQSHPHSVFEFCEGVNALVGLSDAGKSAVLRAIGWVLTNRPSGSGFISHFAQDDTYVEVEVNGHVIRRTRGKSTNTYTVDGDVLAAVGQTVPPCVTEAFNMNDINIMTQMEGVFLLAMSPGSVAKTLNDACGLSKIDTVQQRAQSATRDLTAEIAGLTKSREMLVASLKELDFVHSLEKDVEQLIQAEKEVMKVSDQCDALAHLLNRIDKLASSINDMPVDDILCTIDNVERSWDLYQSAKGRVITLRESIDGVHQMQEVLHTCIELCSAEGYIDAVNRSEDNLVKIQGESQALRRLTTSIRECQKRLADAKSFCQQAVDELAANAPDVCPLCGASGGTYHVC